MDYKEVTNLIILHAGGIDNVEGIKYCSNRLRFRLKDQTKIQSDLFQNTDGIMEFLNHDGTYQVVLTSQMDAVYKEIVARLSASIKQPEELESLGILDRAMEFLSAVCYPIISVLTGACLLKIVLIILAGAHMIGDQNPVYKAANVMVEVVFYFFPFLLALSASKRFKSNPYVALLIAGVLMQPDFSYFVGQKTVTVLNMPISVNNHGVAIIPLLFGVFISARIEVAIKDLFGERINSMWRPILTIFLVIPIILMILSPIGILCGNVLGAGVVLISTIFPMLGCITLGLLTPIMLLFGMQYGFIPVREGVFVINGMDHTLGPGMLVAFVAQAGAAIYVAVKTHRKDIRLLSVSTAVASLFGFCEPVILGINIRLKKPFFAGMIGGAVGGLYMGLTSVVRYGDDIPGILSLYAYKDGTNPWNLMNCIIGCFVAFIAAFLIAAKLGFQETILELVEPQKKVAIQTKYDPMVSNYIKDITHYTETEGEEIHACISGRAIPLQHVNDKTFSEELLGKGVAIIPYEASICSPVTGEVILLFETGHAIGILSENDTEVLIHIGLDTVQAQSKYFHPKVKIGDKVKMGETLIEFDMEALKAIGYDMVIPMTICNSADYKEVISLINQDVEKKGPLTKVVL